MPISTDGGQQYAITMTWQLYQGNWWVAVGNKWVGYYPGANFRGGQMSKNSKYIMYGEKQLLRLAISLRGKWEAESMPVLVLAMRRIKVGFITTIPR